jgi:hypothetical protein
VVSSALRGFDVAQNPEATGITTYGLAAPHYFASGLDGHPVAWFQELPRPESRRGGPELAGIAIATCGPAALDYFVT